MTSEATEIREAIEGLIGDRLQAKLKGVKDDDVDKRRDLRQAYTREAWLAAAAKRVQQIQLVTHNIKPTHPDARGSNIHSSSGNRCQ